MKIQQLDYIPLIRKKLDENGQIPTIGQKGGLSQGDIRQELSTDLFVRLA